MIRSERMGLVGSEQRRASGPVLYFSNGVAPRAKEMPNRPRLGGPELVPPASRRRLIGRKGRQTLARRRALDGAFITVAMGVAALLWWGSL